MSSSHHRRLTYANVVSTLALVLALGGGALAAASSNPGSDGVIHGCYQPKKGNLRVIASGKACLRRERAVSWNQRGPQGVQGLRGLGGTDGANGTNGTNGIDAATNAVVRTAAPATVPAGSFGNATATCNPGERPIAGGVNLSAGTATITDDTVQGPNGGAPTSWFGQALGGATGDTLHVSVVCVSP
jgi:hypothetical protein